MLALQYVTQIFRRAFHRSTGGADTFSTLLALAVPTAAKFAGVNVSESVGVELLAYLGAFTVALFLVRLIFTAPYTLWRAQVAETAGLRLELSKPEQIEFARMARIRAKKRVKLAALINQMEWQPFLAAKSNRDKLSGQYMRATILMGEAAVSSSFDAAFERFFDGLQGRKAADKEGRPDTYGYTFRLADDMVEYLHGRITAEQLALKIPPEPPKEPELPLAEPQEAEPEAKDAPNAEAENGT